MKKIVLLSLLITTSAFAVENPLISAPADNLEVWKEKIKKFKKPKLESIKEYPKPFHSPNGYEYEMNDVCSACHTFAAHKKDEKYAPFYNAHGTFMSCNTCHFVKDNLTYKWGEVKGGKVVLLDKGDFYGLKYVKIGERVFLSGESSNAKIIPVLDGVPVELPVKTFKNSLRNVDFVAKIHNALTDRPLKCEDCHRKNGKLDFRALGFSPERVKDLEENEIVEGLKEYKVIHFPKFIW